MTMETLEQRRWAVATKVVVALVLGTSCAASDGVVLSLTTNQPSYLIGEPIRMTLRVDNESDSVVRGHFRLDTDEYVDIFIRPEGGQFRMLEKQPRMGPDEGINGVIKTLRADSLVVAAHRSDESHTSLVLRPGTDRLLLDHPGEYEIYAVCRPWPRRDASLRTKAIRVTILAPEGESAIAFESYVKGGFPALVETRVGIGTDRDALRRALAFLSAFPSTPYTDDVREVALAGLARLSAVGIASDEERQLLNELSRTDSTKK